MNHRNIQLAAIGFLTVLFVLAAFLAASHATTSSSPDRSHIQIVSYASGLTGFFDASTGRLYLYDSEVRNCVAVRQLVEPGEPMKRLKN